ncbi:MAG TPA: helix-turn-helix domain-containing protein [Fastidiosipila sp.]|nr:helix-turn-helix domain-containing protein [Fastidiosipila sp.]
MSKHFNDLITGLTEAIAIERGELKGRKTVFWIEPVKRYSPSHVRRIRMQAGMTQSVFAEYMGVHKKTVEAWEKGTNRPTGTACRLLNVLEKGEAKSLPFIKKIDIDRAVSKRGK